MNSRKSCLFLVVTLVAVAIGVTACPPAFFSGTSFNFTIYTDTTAFGPQGEGVWQKVIAPGTLAQGAVNPGSTVDIYVDCTNDTTRRLELWDGDSAMYRLISSNPAWAAERMKDFITIKPNIDSEDLVLEWVNADSNYPVLKGNTDVLSAYSSGTIFEITLHHEINGQHVFKVSDWTMAQDRVLYLRGGSGDVVRPSILAASLADGDTAVSVDHEFHLWVDEPLGNLQSMLVEPGNSVDPSVIHSMPVIDSIVAGGTVDYKFDVPRDLKAATDYYWMIIKRNDGTGGLLPLAGPNVVYTQDLSGNSLADPSDLFDEVEAAQLVGGSTTHIMVYELKFTTAP